MESAKFLSIPCPDATFVLEFGSRCAFQQSEIVQSSEEYANSLIGLLPNAGRLCRYGHENSHKEAAKTKRRMRLLLPFMRNRGVQFIVRQRDWRPLEDLLRPMCPTKQS